MKEFKPGRGGLVTHRTQKKKPDFLILVSEAQKMLMSLQTFHCLLPRNQISLDL